MPCAKEVMSDSAVINRDTSHSWIYPTNYAVRDYQREIVETCLKENTLVSLPTGLGKTLIAAVVMYNFYRWFPAGKIVFMAPTRPLVSQQIAACRDIMGLPEDCLAQLEGSVSISTRETLWQEKRIFFCTPQVVDNDLYAGSCPAASIVCLIVDEAHRAASSNYAYAKVIRALGNQQVRVVALSATPGTDKQSIQNVLRHLKISRVEYRSEDSADIAQYTHDKDVDVIKCRASSGNGGGSDELCMLSSSRLQRYLDELLQLMGTVLQQNGLLVSSDPNNINLFVLNEAEKACQDRRTPLPNRSDATHALRIIKFILEGRRELAGAGSAKLWEHLKTHPPASASSNMDLLLFRHSAYEEMVQLLRVMDHSVASKHVRHGRGQGGSSSTEQRAKISMLKKVLLEHFNLHNQNSNSRVIVFVNLRSTVQEVVIELSHCEGLRVNQFIGQGVSKSSSLDVSLSLSSSSSQQGSGRGRGQSQQEQQAIVRAFNAGEFNVLVATSIAEEGLDISEVDLVVSYDVVTSPVRMLQRMGRTGRKRAGRAVMLVMEGKEEAKVYKSSDRIGHVNDIYSSCLGDLTYCQHSPRMLPEGIEPVMVLQNMQKSTSSGSGSSSNAFSSTPSTHTGGRHQVPGKRTVNLTGDDHATLSSSRPAHMGSFFQWSSGTCSGGGSSNTSNNNKRKNNNFSSKQILLAPPPALRGSTPSLCVDLSADSPPPAPVPGGNSRNSNSNIRPLPAPNHKSQMTLSHSNRNTGSKGIVFGKPQPLLVQQMAASARAVTVRCFLCDCSLVLDENSSPARNDDDHDRTCAECRHTMLLSLQQEQGQTQTQAQAQEEGQDQDQTNSSRNVETVKVKPKSMAATMESPGKGTADLNHHRPFPLQQSVSLGGTEQLPLPPPPRITTADHEQMQMAAFFQSYSPFSLPPARGRGGDTSTPGTTASDVIAASCCIPAAQCELPSETSSSTCKTSPSLAVALAKKLSWEALFTPEYLRSRACPQRHAAHSRADDKDRALVKVSSITASDTATDTEAVPPKTRAPVQLDEASLLPHHTHSRESPSRDYDHEHKKEDEDGPSAKFEIHETIFSSSDDSESEEEGGGDEGKEEDGVVMGDVCSKTTTIAAGAAAATAAAATTAAATTAAGTSANFQKEKIELVRAVDEDTTATAFRVCETIFSSDEDDDDDDDDDDEVENGDGNDDDGKDYGIGERAARVVQENGHQGEGSSATAATAVAIGEKNRACLEEFPHVHKESSLVVPITVVDDDDACLDAIETSNNSKPNAFKICETVFSSSDEDSDDNDGSNGDENDDTSTELDDTLSVNCGVGGSASVEEEERRRRACHPPAPASTTATATAAAKKVSLPPPRRNVRFGVIRRKKVQRKVEDEAKIEDKQDKEEKEVPLTQHSPLAPARTVPVPAPVPEATGGLFSHTDALAYEDEDEDFDMFSMLSQAPVPKVAAARTLNNHPHHHPHQHDSARSDAIAPQSHRNHLQRTGSAGIIDAIVDSDDDEEEEGELELDRDRDSDAMPCAACTETDTRDDQDPGVFCDGPCGCFLHLQCCGLSEVPAATHFYCESCAARRLSSFSSTSSSSSHRDSKNKTSCSSRGANNLIKCALCGNTGGSLRKSACGRVWVHSVCVVFTPELTLCSQSARLSNLTSLDSDRQTLQCSICKGRGGSNIQCAYGDCLTSFHPHCAFHAKKQMVTRLDNASYCHSEIYCNDHKARVLPGTLLSATLPLAVAGRPIDPCAEQDVLERDTPQCQSLLRRGHVTEGLSDEEDLLDSATKTPNNANASAGAHVAKQQRKRLRQAASSVGIKSPSSTLAVAKSKKQKKTLRANPFIDDEAALSGSDSGDEHNLSQLDGELSGSFINDGAYTQVEDSGGGGDGRRGGRGRPPANSHTFYRQLDRTPSQASGVKFRFRGGDRPLPITEAIVRRLHAPSPPGTGAEGEVGGGGVTGGGGGGSDDDDYEEDSFLVGEQQGREGRQEERRRARGRQHDAFTSFTSSSPLSSPSSSSSSPLLSGLGDSSFEL